ncbi:hypothetical protein FHS59_004686 [Algoriphagus iocasae]|uniref:Uncharacterized protein n=1 Tax=Algoriphagus iocasae TaxID=1836499 RepID=A0A841ML68_9BACT|nr:hypothetical protein [Algoriphagus iocasae]
MNFLIILYLKPSFSFINICFNFNFIVYENFIE